MKTISIHVSQQAYQEFQVHSARTGRPVAELIRQAMAEYLEEHAGSGKSILDLAPHDSGKVLKGWTRSEIFDEMLG